MNADVEETLDAELRAVVARLRAAPQLCTSPAFTANVMSAIRAGADCPQSAAALVGPVVLNRPRLWWRRMSPIGLAASLVVFLSLGVLFLRAPRHSAAWSTTELVSCQRADGTFSTSSAAPYVQAFAVTALAKDPAKAAGSLDSAVGALMRDQNAEGGWANPSLSACNVVALRQAAEAGVAGALRAYRRGRRYLQTHGIGELSAADLVREAKDAFARLDASADRGLACSVALCTRDK